MINPFKKIIELFQRKSYLSVGQSFGLYGEAIQRPTNADYLDAFEVSFLVHACVDKIAKKVANTKFKLYRVKGVPGNEKITEITNHPLLDLLAQVNPYTTKFTMLDLTQTYQELLGNAYWYKVRGDNSKKILELWALRPDWVTIKQDSESYIKAFEYRMPNGEVKTFDPKDIIQFKTINPKSSLYGLPTIKPAMDVVESLIYASRWNKNFFKNSAIPDTLLISKTAMTPAQKAEFKEQWDDKYQGVKNAHKLGIIDGEIDLKQLSLSAKDMDFEKMTEVTTQQILTSFGVPKPIVSMTSSMNRATSETAVYTFLSETIEPKIRGLIESLNEFLVPEFGSDLYLDFEDPTPENREAITKEYDLALKNNWLLINEVRDREGLLPIKGGWDFYLPMSMNIAGGSEESPTKMLKVKGTTEKEYKKHKEEKEQEKLRTKVLAGKRSLKLKMKLKSELVRYFLQQKAKALSAKQKANWWKEHNAFLKSDEKLFLVFVRRLLKKQKERILDAVGSEFLGKGFGKEKVLDSINWDIENRIFFELAMPIYTDITERRGIRASKLIGGKFELTKEAVLNIEQKSMTFAEQINLTTEKKLRKALGEGISSGEGVSELSERVSGVFKTRTKAESERIARTEVISASNGAELEAYKQSGVIEKKEWLAEPDACEICAALDGEVVKLNKMFSGGFDYPPAHPNCRCAILPVIE